MGGKVGKSDRYVDVTELIEKWDAETAIAETTAKPFDITKWLNKCNYPGTPLLTARG